MRRRTKNYSQDDNTQENTNYGEKYAETGESEFSRDLTIPFDENDVLSERHFVLGDDAFEWERRMRQELEQDNISGVAPRNYVRPDANIYEDVCETLGQLPQVDASEIEVEVDHGVVTLKGVVHKRAFKRAAEEAIENIPGVIDVMNQIHVQADKGGLIQHNIGMI